MTTNQTGSKDLQTISVDQTDLVVVAMAAEHARRHKNLDIDPETEIALQDIHNFSVALLEAFRASDTSEPALLGMIFLESDNAELVDIPQRELERLLTTLEYLLDDHSCPALARLYARTQSSWAPEQSD